MRILYVSQYYPPDMGAPSARVSELAREWQRLGHEVTVLTAFSHHPHGTKRQEDRGRLWRWEQDGDVPVLRAYVYAAPNAGFLWRIVSYLSFMLSAIVLGTLLTPKVDVVIATSPQLFTGVAGWWLGTLRRASFVFEVRDLWPESIVGVGAMRPSRAIRLLELLAAWLYRSADQIVAVGDGYKQQIVTKYRVDPAKIEIVTNGVDLNHFQLRTEERSRVRRELGYRDELVVLYLGTHGMAHGLEFVLDAAQRLSDETNVRFLFVGDGAERQKLQEDALRRGLKNTLFLGPQSRDKVVGFYAAADVCLVPLRSVELFRQVLPSKLFEIWAMQRPVILSVAGRARVLLEEAQAGLAISPEDTLSLLSAIELLRRDPALRSRLGNNGRPFVERRFGRPALAARYLEVLDTLISKSACPTNLSGHSRRFAA